MRQRVGASTERMSQRLRGRPQIPACKPRHGSLGVRCSPARGARHVGATGVGPDPTPDFGNEIFSVGTHSRAPQLSRRTPLIILSRTRVTAAHPVAYVGTPEHRKIAEEAAGSPLAYVAPGHGNTMPTPKFGRLDNNLCALGNENHTCTTALLFNEQKPLSAIGCRVSSSGTGLSTASYSSINPRSGDRRRRESSVSNVVRCPDRPARDRSPPANAR